jgi:hypothetical protein
MTITTYETPTHAFCVLQYGWKPEIVGVRFGDGPFYHIRTHAFQKYVERRITSYSHRMSDIGPSWFKTVYF